MLTDAGAIKVLDFGIAKLVAGDDPAGVAFHPLAAEPGVIMGTLPYMSPEQLEGGPIDHRTDLWAVGIMLYQMVTGAHPVIHDGANLQRALLDLASLDLAMPSVSERRSDLGPLAGIIDRCLLKDREQRTRDARVLLPGKPLSPPLVHEGEMESAAFSSDGTRVVTARWDNTARVWDAATGKPLSPPLVHQGDVHSAAFSPDGTRVVTASSDHTARVWETRLDETPPAGLSALAARSPFVLSDGVHVLRTSLARGPGAN